MFHFMLKRHMSYECCKSINSNSLSHITLRPNLIKQDENSFPSYNHKCPTVYTYNNKIYTYNNICNTNTTMYHTSTSTTMIGLTYYYLSLPILLVLLILIGISYYCYYSK